MKTTTLNLNELWPALVTVLLTSAACSTTLDGPGQASPLIVGGVLLTPQIGPFSLSYYRVMVPLWRELHRRWLCINGSALC